MTPERWQAIERLYHEALGRAAPERAALLDEACGGDKAFRREVEWLLAQAQPPSADAFPSVEAAARVIAQGGNRPGLTWDVGMGLVGRQIGGYQILSRLGAGGMGEVYRARDSKLGRDVAIKVLPSLSATDAERLRRFEREARLLASLNHPRIGAIYGIEQAEGIIGLVLELVEGQTLTDRLAHGPVPIREALKIAGQVAEALEAAHEKGIVHRDLKPANIALTRDGDVKVLDFGLAKAFEATEPGQELAQMPTVTATEFRPGDIMGTPAYMSPEQARGQAIDKRTDIWAFGCVVFEMLSGRMAFSGETVSDTIAAVLDREPAWDRLPAITPPTVGRLLRHCLEKDPKDRLRDIGDARFELTTDVPVAAPRSPGWRRLTALTAGAFIVAGLSSAVVWLAMRPAPPAPPRVSRLALPTSGEAALTISGVDRDLTITPDGSRVVYVGNRGTQLFVRALDALEPVAVFTGAPRGPFVSPDGQWIGFVDLDATSELKKVPLTGGPAVTLATLDGAPRGATWAPGDTIIFATATVATGLQRVAAAGGSPTALTQPDRAQGDGDHVWPELLPGGRTLLFTILPAGGGLAAAQVAVLDLETGGHKVVVRGGTHAQYVPSGGGSREAERGAGHLVYLAGGSLQAVPFELATGEVRGTPRVVVSEVMTTLAGGVDAVVTGDGTLAYARGVALRTLVWVDRQGRETPIAAPPRAYAYPQLSPDGTRIAVFAGEDDLDLWVWDLARATLTRLTHEPGLDREAIWMPDSRRLVFRSDRDGQVGNLYVQEADGMRPATRLTSGANLQVATAITADGTRVLFNELKVGLDMKASRDMWLLTLTPTPRVEPLIETRFEERGGIVSPDGRWMAYESNSSGGRFEIYVRPFPNVGDGQWQISTAGGVQPLWARSGRELFYLGPDGAVLSVPVETRDAFRAGTATKLVAGGYFTGAGAFLSRQYDVSPDDQRFLMMKERGVDQADLIVVQHWVEELKRLAP